MEKMGSYCGRVLGQHQTTNIFLIVSNDFQCRVKDSRLTEVDLVKNVHIATVEVYLVY